jgi:hypothetical protein
VGSGRRLRRWLAGEDAAAKDALPLGELLDPLALAAVVVLVVNDRALKGVLPGWLTGKLSDVAGLVVAPLLVTALVGCALALAARLGADVDPSLSPRRLALAIAVVGAGFAVVELWPPATRAYLATLAAIGLPSSATRDPSDLAALPALAAAAWIGLREIARVPLGRVAVVARRAAGDPADATRMLADVRRRARDGAAVERLATALAEHGARPTAEHAAAVDRALDALRM